MDGCTDTVTSPASFCEESVCPRKQSSTIISPLSGDLTGLRKSKEVVYKSGSRMEDKETKLNKDVMPAKRDCMEWLDHDYTNNSSANISTESQQVQDRR